MIFNDWYDYPEIKTAIIIKKNRLILMEKRKRGVRWLLDTKVSFGLNGFTDNKTEGDGKSPVGVFSPGIAFGTHKSVKTKLDYVAIKDDHYWVDDPESRYYNQLVELSAVTPDWSSAERMKDFEREYEYGININANPENEKGKGSALFLHCAGDNNYTTGCIAADRKSVLYCIKKLDPFSKIVILP